MIEVDSREPIKVVNKLRKLTEDLKVKTLPCGDYFVKEKGLMVERKSIMDFVSSYCTGHIQEQLENMEQNFDLYFVYISGKYDYLSFKNSHYKHLNEQSISKMKNHLLLSFPGLRIVEFTNDNQLMKGLMDLSTYDRTARQKEIIRREQTHQDIFVSILTCFRGISLRKARAIVIKYLDIHSLMASLEECEGKENFGIIELNKTDFKRLKEFYQKNLP